MYATIQENSLIMHRLMLPPNNHGRITYIAEPGGYSVDVS